MKIAIWRYGLPYQLAENSTVGGGLIAQTVTKALAVDHELHLVGKASKEVAAAFADGKLTDVFAGYHPDATDLDGYDVAVILTGPANGLYGGYAKTYELLDQFTGHAVYCQWDCALPFNFEPKPVSGVEMPSPDKARWTLMTQVPEVMLPARARVDYVGYSQCFFEACELDREWLHPTVTPIPRLGYFGGDRPGRIKELKRWASSGVPIDVWGRWSEKSMAKVPFGNVSFRGACNESGVAAMLNKYAATMYIADAAYVKQDFVAQRLIENATAGVPVIYSDAIQPSVKKMLLNTGHRSLMVASPEQFKTLFDVICQATHEERHRMVERHQAAIRRIRTWKKGHTIVEAFKEIL